MVSVHTSNFSEGRGRSFFFVAVEVSRDAFLCQNVKFVVMDCTWWTRLKDSLTHSLFNQQYFPLFYLNQLTTIDHSLDH